MNWQAVELQVGGALGTILGMLLRGKTLRILLLWPLRKYLSQGDGSLGKTVVVSAERDLGVELPPPAPSATTDTKEKDNGK